MTGFKNVKIADEGNLDSFGRLKVSQALSLFDSQFTYNLNPLIYEQVTAETGATITYDSTNGCALMEFTATPSNGKAFMQSFEWIPYQPGKSQLVFCTFNFNSEASSCTKFAGLGVWGENGFFFDKHTGNQLRFSIFSTTDEGDQGINQTSWNVDTLDGSGDASNPSGITLDITKTQIFFVSFQALYVGRVRMGFVIDGVPILCHEFLNTNEKTYPYIRNANLPIQVGMRATATVTTDMRFICAAVISEGGRDVNFGYELSREATATALSATRAHAISIRPKALFNSLENRISIGFIEVDILVTGSYPIKWDLSIGQALSGGGTWADINATYSASEYADNETLSGGPAIIIDEGYVAASTQTKGSEGVQLTQRYPITLNAAGTNRDLGTLCLCVTGIGGNSDCRVSVKFKEVR